MFSTVFDPWSYISFSPWMAAPAALDRSAPEIGSRTTGGFSEHRYESDAGTLRYKLYVPRCYVGEPLPLIVMLHGCAQDADDFAAGTAMNRLAETYGCLVAYPQQTTGRNGNKCWNWFDPAHYQRGQGEPALIAGATRMIMSNYAVDRRRVCVGGLSSGGAMAIVMGRTYPDLFSAIGCHSGLAHASATDRYGAMLAMRDGVDVNGLSGPHHGIIPPMIVFHGDMDSVVHYKNGVGVVQQSIDCHLASSRERGAAVKLEVVSETGRCRGRRFTRQLYREHSGKVVVEQWTVHGTGHAWSGGNRRGSYTDDMGPDASDEMMRFFMR